MLRDPLLLTHWDPDLYPERPVPLLHELVVHILAHGRVWLKEVDLFLNPTISSVLSDPSDRKIFRSLVDTGRIELLIADPATIRTFARDPKEEPFLATAEARDEKKPLKSQPWKLDDKTKQLCKELDTIFGFTARRERTGATTRITRPRSTPPAEQNQFADKLREVLEHPAKAWRQRDAFKDISPAMEKEFPKFCRDHERALALLARARVKPNATRGFYRSLAYQCADEFASDGPKAVQAMKNLAQSVYAYCELKREKAAGTYSGKRLAEMPPDKACQHPGDEIFRIEVVPLRKSIAIPLDDNIGAVISRVLGKCENQMSLFWELTHNAPSPERDFQVAWSHVAEAFKNEVHIPTSQKHRIFQPAGLIVAAASLILDASTFGGFSLAPGILATEMALTAITSFGPKTVDLFRGFRADQRRQEIGDSLRGAASIRCSRIK